MEKNITIIEKICGQKPPGTDFTIIENDPSFIFVPQSGYDLRVLYDIDGNIINVSSWLECANYVNGGWTNLIPGTINWEKNTFIVYLIICCSYLVKDSVLRFLNKK